MHRGFSALEEKGTARPARGQTKFENKQHHNRHFVRKTITTLFGIFSRTMYRKPEINFYHTAAATRLICEIHLINSSFIQCAGGSPP